MDKLNLPAFDCKIKKINSVAHVLDPFRKRYVCLTPEEWVRQHILHYLVNYLGYPLPLIRLELPLKYGELKKRADILINRVAKGIQPLMIMECKAPSQRIRQFHLMQVCVYNKEINAPFIALTNGIHHLFFKVDVTKGTCQQLKKVPHFKELCTELDAGS